MHIHILTCMYPLTCIHINTHVRMYLHVYTHTTHVHAHTHIHTQIHTRFYLLINLMARTPRSTLIVVYSYFKNYFDIDAFSVSPLRMVLTFVLKCVYF